MAHPNVHNWKASFRTSTCCGCGGRAGRAVRACGTGRAGGAGRAANTPIHISDAKAMADLLACDFIWTSYVRSQIDFLTLMVDLLPYSFMWTHACLEYMYAQRSNMHFAWQAPSESRTTLHGCAARSMRVERERTTRGTISATSMFVVCLHAKATQHSPDAYLDRWGASGSEHPLAQFHLNLRL
jgi:hypothetical protein